MDGRKAFFLPQLMSPAGGNIASLPLTVCLCQDTCPPQLSRNYAPLGGAVFFKSSVVSAGYKPLQLFFVVGSFDNRKYLAKLIKRGYNTVHHHRSFRTMNWLSCNKKTVPNWFCCTHGLFNKYSLFRSKIKTQIIMRSSNYKSKLSMQIYK